MVSGLFINVPSYTQASSFKVSNFGLKKHEKPKYIYKKNPRTDAEAMTSLLKLCHLKTVQVVKDGLGFRRDT